LFKLALLANLSKETMGSDYQDGTIAIFFNNSYNKLWVLLNEWAELLEEEEIRKRRETLAWLERREKRLHQSSEN